MQESSIKGFSLSVAGVLTMPLLAVESTYLSGSDGSCEKSETGVSHISNGCLACCIIPVFLRGFDYGSYLRYSNSHLFDLGVVEQKDP
jgi:hypothetical protein